MQFITRESRLNDGRIIGRKRKRNALSQENNENVNNNIVNAGVSILPPNKRFKTGSPKNGINGKNGKNGKSNNNIGAMAGMAGMAGMAAMPRVFGSNLTNQNDYYIRNRTCNNMNNNNDIINKNKNGKMIVSNKNEIVKPNLKASVKPMGTRMGVTKKENKGGESINERINDNNENKDISSDSEEEDIDIDVASNADKTAVAKASNESEHVSMNKFEEWDMINVSNDLECVEYIDDIMNHLKICELKHCNFENSDFMSLQKDITYKMRLILLDWLCGVHRKFRLVPRVLYLTINILDRFLSIKQINRNKLQLLGCACLWISSKYHEIYAPECSDFVYISDGAFTKNDLLQMEIEIMVALSFELTVPTPITFAQRFIKIGTFIIEKQFIKFAEIMFDKYLSLNSSIVKNNGNGSSHEIKDMYIKGICELLDNGFNRSMSKFGSLSNTFDNNNNNNSNKEKRPFGLTIGLQGIRSDIIDHIGNVLQMCDVVKHCQNGTNNNRNNNNNNNNNNGKSFNENDKKKLMIGIKKELRDKYGINSERGIEHIFAIKKQMQDVLEKMDILCHLTYYLIEHGLLDYESGLSRLLPSKLAASALAYSLLGCGILHDWPNYLMNATGYSLHQLLPFMKKLDIVRQNKKHKSIQSKYNRAQYGKVAQLNFQKMNLKKYFDN